MKKIILLITILYSQLSFGQKQEYIYRSSDSTVNCYLLITPNNTKIKGLIIRDYSSLPKNNNKKYPYKWKKLALKNGLAILYTVSSNYFPELYYNDTCLNLLDEIIHEVVKKHNIPSNNLFIGGISASGTRALKYVQYCEMGKSKYNLKINGVFSVDSPLDLERFYYSALNHKSNFKKGMLWEAKLITKVFPKKLNGTPKDNYKNYRKQSVFSYKDSTGGNAKHLLNTSTIFFHEPDINWWVSERGATYYDINSFDIAGIFNFLKLKGHQDIELITTTKKGYDRNGNRKCHSWSIVDEDYLINWILKRIK